MTMAQDEHKKAAALAALEYVEPGAVIGVGTGSTVNHFIDALAGVKPGLAGAVASSEATAARLNRHGIPVLELNDTGDLPLYVDGADEADPRLCLIKGGGGALTREKIIAAASSTFVCIADHSKMVDVLGRFPLPVEIVPLAQAFLMRRLAALGGRAVARGDFVTDNGNLILDVHGLDISEPVALEESIDHLAGVVSNGIFARRPADVLLLAGDKGVEELRHPGGLVA